MCRDVGENSEDDLTIPRAAMNKMIKEMLPHVRVANDARELILKCCTEFIHHVATQANTICGSHHKKTITGDHLIQALDTLGFEDYRPDMEQVLKDFKQTASKRRRQSTRLENLGIPEEKLLVLQQELFAKVTN
ncbi:DR1 [Cordylochernes scorpioides]|uniref:Protein Dr1 n=1 Tax=Cordylochernes scorpioides TaxID=51811 RepID=A0ABY6K4Y5_9ARAC|nr:DR1 [Cordylochernes scorpioides]